MTHNEYSRLNNTSLGLTPTTYFLSVRFCRLSKVSIPVFGFGTLPTPGVFPRKVWTIQSAWMSPLYLSSLNGFTILEGILDSVPKRVYSCCVLVTPVDIHSFAVTPVGIASQSYIFRYSEKNLPKINI